MDLAQHARPNASNAHVVPARRAVEFEPLKEASSFRKMAAAMWSAPNDPSILGAMDIDATRALAFIEAARSRGERVTMTHLVARATAMTIARHPETNVKVRFGGRLERRL